MSHFHPHQFEQQPEQFAEPQTTNGFSIASLVCSLIVCCPLITILGPILGIVALVNIGSPPRQRGKGLAVAGIIIGIVATVISGWAYYAVTVRAVYMFTGPEEVMSAGFAGDIPGFKDSFRRGALVPDEEARAFLDELENRYGTYVAMHFDEQQEPQEGDRPGTMIMFYIVEFTQQDVEAEAEVHFFTSELESITIRDAELGDLRFPPPR